MLTAHRRDLRRKLDRQAPAGNVEQMHAPVPKLPRPVIPEPVPIIMEAIRIERPIRSRPQPQIVVDAGRNLRILPEPDRFALMDRPGLGQMYAPQFSALHIFDRRQKMRAGSLLQARLNDAAVFSPRGHHGRPFGESMRYRLFDIYVFSRFAGENRHQGVPVVGSGDYHRVQGRIVQQAAKVCRHLRRMPLQRFDLSGGLRQQ